MRTIRIGSGAGYGGDRIEPAIGLIRRGDLDYIIFECLAERTVSIAQPGAAKIPSSATMTCSITASHASSTPLSTFVPKTSELRTS